MDRLLKILSEMALPFAYDHFAEGESPNPPFICYLLPGSDNFSANGRVYYKINEIHIELYDEIADKIFKLRVQREKCTVDTAARDAQITRINDLQDYIKKQPASLTEFDEALVKRWLKQITVWDDHFTVERKSGLKIDIED